MKILAGVIGVVGVSGLIALGGWAWEQQEGLTRQKQLEDIVIKQDGARAAACKQLQRLCEQGKLPAESHECAIAYSPNCPEEID